MPTSEEPKGTAQDQPPNFREAGKLYIVRCHACGRENYAPAVASGQCAWCGWSEDALGVEP